MLPSQVRRRRWLTSDTRKRIRKTKKIIFAIPAAATAIPEKPSTAAKSATIKNPNAQRSIATSFVLIQLFQGPESCWFACPNFLSQPRSSPVVRQRRNDFHTVEALRDWNECCSHHECTRYISLRPSLKGSLYVRSYARMFPLSCGGWHSSQRARSNRHATKGN